MAERGRWARRAESSGLTDCPPRPRLWPCESAQPIIAASDRQLAETSRSRRNIGDLRRYIRARWISRSSDTVIDARTPAEYALDHVPGAVSAPVLDDMQRAEVGHALQAGVAVRSQKARRARWSRKNVARHVETLFGGKEKAGGRWSIAGAAASAPARWRTSCARSAGTRDTLEGGYRAYRRWVVEQLASRAAAQFDFVVVHGPTGSGKSRLLAALARAGAQVLDLEALAAHRGSVLGGLPGSRSRRRSGSRAAPRRARRFDRARPVFVEGESKKIGEIQVPEALMARMRASPCVRARDGARRASRCSWRSIGTSSTIARRWKRSSIASPLCTAASGSRNGKRSPRAALARVRRAASRRALRPRLPALHAAQLHPARRRARGCA